MKKNYKFMIEPQNIITETTMALIPYYTDTANLHCQMVGKYGDINIQESSLHILKESCLFYGCDFDGSLQSSRKILEGQKILPIMVSVEFEYCMIPLSSPMKKDCIWIAFQHIGRIIPDGENSIILFKNQDMLEVNITKSSLDSRINKASRLVCTYHFRRKMVKDLRNRNLTVAEERRDYEKGQGDW
ncbi:MAG TPA: competence protein ComK [Metabacillus sp.]|nr:competence protein ComK [Metabacillus sp.]